MLYDLEDTNSYEHLALLILGSYCSSSEYTGLYRKYFKKLESPDWQSDELDLGIEVTISINQSLASDISVYKKITKNTSNSLSVVKQRLDKIDKKNKFGGKLSEPVKGGIMMDSPQPNNIDTLRRSIKSKINRSKSYSKFKDNWLFIFFYGHLDENMVLDCIISEDNHPVFSRYIIYNLGNEELLVVDSPYKKLNKVYFVQMNDVCLGKLIAESKAYDKTRLK